MQSDSNSFTAMCSSLHISYLMLVLVSVKNGAEGLQPFDKFREGSCSGVPMKPLTNLNRKWVSKVKFDKIDSLQPYIPGGNKYQLYRIAATHPDYRDMREDFFYYNFCYKRNTSSTQPVGQSIAFGRVLADYDVRVPENNPGMYVEVTPRDPQLRYDVLKEYVTLTDHKTFVFVTMCWTGVDQRAWLVFSSKPTLDPVTEHLILEHAVSLGFKRENAVFIRYRSCEATNPVVATAKMPDDNPVHHNFIKERKRDRKRTEMMGTGSHLTSVRAYGSLDSIRGSIVGKRWPHKRYHNH